MGLFGKKKEESSEEQPEEKKKGRVFGDPYIELE